MPAFSTSTMPPVIGGMAFDAFTPAPMGSDWCTPIQTHYEGAFYYQHEYRGLGDVNLINTIPAELSMGWMEYESPPIADQTVIEAYVAAAKADPANCLANYKNEGEDMLSLLDFMNVQIEGLRANNNFQVDDTHEYYEKFHNISRRVNNDLNKIQNYVKSEQHRILNELSYADFLCGYSLSTALITFMADSFGNVVQLCKDELPTADISKVFDPEHCSQDIVDKYFMRSIEGGVNTATLIRQLQTIKSLTKTMHANTAEKWNALNVTNHTDEFRDYLRDFFVEIIGESQEFGDQGLDELMEAFEGQISGACDEQCVIDTVCADQGSMTAECRNTMTIVSIWHQISTAIEAGREDISDYVDQLRSHNDDLQDLRNQRCFELEGHFNATIGFLDMDCRAERLTELPLNAGNGLLWMIQDEGNYCDSSCDEVYGHRSAACYSQDGARRMSPAFKSCVCHHSANMGGGRAERGAFPVSHFFADFTGEQQDRFEQRLHFANNRTMG